MHQVALLRNACEQVEELLGHEVRLIVAIERIHAVLDYVGAQLLIVCLIDIFNIRYRT